MLKKGDMAIVKEIDRNNVHPVNTKVVIELVGNDKTDPRPYYARSNEGRSCYWYGEHDLRKVAK